MFYVSPQLTVVMLAVVPPMSLGAVCAIHYICSHITDLLQVFLWEIHQAPFEQNARSVSFRCSKLSHNIITVLQAVGEMTKVATESLSAFRTVQAFNAQPTEKEKFAETVHRVLTLARREALASGVFFGATGWSGNVTILCLLGYGNTQFCTWSKRLSWA